MPKIISNLVVVITNQYKERRITLDQAEDLLVTISTVFEIPMFAIKSVIEATQLS